MIQQSDGLGWQKRFSLLSSGDFYQGAGFTVGIPFKSNPSNSLRRCSDKWISYVSNIEWHIFKQRNISIQKAKYVSNIGD